MTTILMIYLITVLVSGTSQAIALKQSRPARDFGIAFVLSMIPIANLAIAGFALGGLLKRRLNHDR